jgi:tight adherence protein B
MKCRLAVATLALLPVCASLFGGPVAAAAPAHALTVRQIDTTKWPAVRVDVLSSGPKLAPTDVNVRDGDRLVADVKVVSLGDSATAVGTVLVIDESGSMAAGGRIESAKAAGHAFIDHLLPNEQVAVVAFSDDPRLVTDFTAARGVLHSAVDGLRAHGETALWEGVRMATGLIAAAPQLQPNIVVLSDGRDTASATSAAEAKAAAIAAKAVTFTVGLGPATSVDGGALRGLADATGGQFFAATDAAALPNIYGSVQGALQSQYELTFTAVGDSPRTVTVTAGGASTQALAAPGTVSRGINANPATVVRTHVPSFLRGDSGKFLIALLVLAAAGLFAWVVIMITSHPASQLTERLAPYGADGEDEHLVAKAGLVQAQTQLVKRAVETASRVAAGRQLLVWLEARLEQANLPVRGMEAILGYGVASLVGAFAILILVGPIAALLLLVLLVIGPPAVLSFLARRRQRQFSKQLPDTLTLLSGTLRAGYSLMQGVEAVAQEVGDPMGEELRRVMVEARLGRSLDDALGDAGERMESDDFDWAVMAIGIQREVGGNLAELLDTVAETMVGRERLRREVKALTAEGRVSAFVIGIMPIGLGLAMWMLNRPYISVLFTDPLGRMAAIGAGLLALFGFWWMKKTIEIEV